MDGGVHAISLAAVSYQCRPNWPGSMTRTTTEPGKPAPLFAPSREKRLAYSTTVKGPMAPMARSGGDDQQTT